MIEILIVDDSELIRTELCDIINLYYSKQNRKAKFHIASSEAEAKRVAKMINPDLIFLDIMLVEAKHAGLDLLKEFKGQFDCKIFMISVVLEPGIRKTCAKLGADGFIDKPFSAEDINNCLEQAITSS